MGLVKAIRSVKPFLYFTNTVVVFQTQVSREVAVVKKNSKYAVLLGFEPGRFHRTSERGEKLYLHLKNKQIFKYGACTPCTN